MYGREKLKTYTSSELYDRNSRKFEIGEAFLKDEADKVMDAMEERISELEAQCTKYQAEPMNNDPALDYTPKWNSVKKGVPTHNRAVAIYPPFKGCEFACYNEFECCWDTEDGDDYLCDLDEVEKWFEIPLPPTTEESSSVEKEK